MATCKGCGKVIWWGVDPDGNTIPLDPTAPVYEVGIEEALGTRHKVTRCDRRLVMVSHFATCPEANRFSGRNKVRKEANP